MFCFKNYQYPKPKIINPMTTQSKPAKSFIIIAVIALLWNIIGIVTFTMSLLISPEALGALPTEERALLESTPAWLNFIYGVAVFTGTLGSFLLLMKKSAAFQVFLVSLVTIIVQMSYWLFATKSMEVYGPTALIMPLLVIVIAIFLVWYSKSAITRGWII
jgi:hypothetical protein